MGKWQLQEAKARLSEVIKRAAREGPQRITVHGDPAAVVISNKEYERLKHPKGSFVKFMRSSPLYGLELNLRREQSLTREVEVSLMATPERPSQKIGFQLREKRTAGR